MSLSYQWLKDVCFGYKYLASDKKTRWLSGLGKTRGEIHLQSELTALSLRSLDPHRRTQTIVIVSTTPVKQVVRFAEQICLVRSSEGCPETTVGGCLRVSAVNIVEYRREL